MVGSLVPQVVHQFEAADGSVRALAQLRALLTGTTTPTPIYSDPDLLSPISQPLTADSAGIFIPFWTDPEIPTRIQIIWAGGDFNNPEIDVDPVNVDDQITADDVDPDLVSDLLGYTPVSPTGTVSFTKPQRYQFNPDPPTAFYDDALGYMGGPVVQKNANYTFVLGDAGKTYKKDDNTAYTWTIPPNSSVAFPLGFKIWVTNLGTAGAVAIARGAGVVLTYAGSTTDGDRSMAAGGAGILVKMATDTWKIFAPDGIT